MYGSFKCLHTLNELQYIPIWVRFERICALMGDVWRMHENYGPF